MSQSVKRRGTWIRRLALPLTVVTLLSTGTPSAAGRTDDTAQLSIRVSVVERVHLTVLESIPCLKTALSSITVQAALRHASSDKSRIVLLQPCNSADKFTRETPFPPSGQLEVMISPD